ncbi:tetratricopeptide repeat protein [Ectobacillus panaciterrae]|uniref:tetratricopeptide repeat protein n=1 Tax=Ectobacillus panaciterrae TaxID=363872 RepID=UPI0004139297|nr:hypothetical protein [Ectobacillus panaciterrae]
MTLSIYTIPVLVFYIIHAIIVLLVIKVFERKKQNGVYKWIGLISVFVPILGTIFGYLAWLLSKFVANDIVHSYDTYTDFQFFNYDEAAIEARKDMELMPFLLGLHSEKTAVRKDLIVRLMDTSIENRGKYLDMALHNMDTETVHYAATIINYLKESYEKRIEQQEGELSAINPSSYLRLCDTYQQYLNSKVVNSFMEEKMYEQFQRVAEEAILYFPGYMEFWNYAAVVYKRLNKQEKALHTAKLIIERFPDRYEGYMRVLELYFEQGDFASIPKVYQAFIRNVSQEEIPSSLEPLLQQVRSI